MLKLFSIVSVFALFACGGDEEVPVNATQGDISAPEEGSPPPPDLPEPIITISTYYFQHTDISYECTNGDIGTLYDYSEYLIINAWDGYLGENERAVHFELYPAEDVIPDTFFYELGYWFKIKYIYAGDVNVSDNTFNATQKGTATLDGADPIIVDYTLKGEFDYSGNASGELERIVEHTDTDVVCTLSSTFTASPYGRSDPVYYGAE